MRKEVFRSERAEMISYNVKRKSKQTWTMIERIGVDTRLMSNSESMQFKKRVKGFVLSPVRLSRLTNGSEAPS
jgi:hypothetical protein